MTVETIIVIPTTSVTGTLNNFPVRINLADMPSAFWTAVDASGNYIRVRDKNDNEVPFDIVSFDKGTNTGELFFKAATLSTLDKAVFKVVVVPGAAAVAVTDTNGRNAVWSDYEAVFMFTSLVNRTGSGVDAVLTGGLGTGVPGWLNLGGSGQAITGNLSTLTAWTMGVSAIPTNVSNNFAMLSYTPKVTSNSFRASLVLRGSSSQWGIWNSVDDWLFDPGAAPVTSERRRFHHTQNGTTDRKIWRDGALAATDTGVVQRPGISGSTMALYIGAEDASLNERFVGALNYVYLRNGELSSEWLAAEYKSWETETFYSVVAAYIDSVSPNSGDPAGGTAVTILGAGFTDATNVTFGGTNATSIVVVSDTEITCVTPAGSVGAVDVVVQGSDGDATLTNGFTYVAVTAPDITSISPIEGSTVGGDTVTITGTGFIGTTSVTFDGNAATGVTVDSDTQITCITPAGTLGLVDVVVTNSAGSDTLIDGFEYVLTAPGTQVAQAPLLVVNKPNQSICVTQVPLLVVNLPLQGTFVTQAPILVPWSPPPLPAPRPIFPDSPSTEVWEWLTVVTTAEYGNEQRAALRSFPRLHSKFNALILEEADRRAVYEFIKTNLTKIFDYPLYPYTTRINAASLSGSQKLYFDPATTDMREGSKLAILNTQDETLEFYDIDTVDSDGATLLVPLTSNVSEGWYVIPVSKFRLNPITGFVMQSIAGEVSLELQGVELRPVLRPDQSTSLTTIDGLLILDKRPLANKNVDEEFDQNVAWLDNSISTPTARTNWYTALASSQRSYLVHRPNGMDYWRAVADYLRGRQKPFLLPTFRADLELSEEPDLGATVLVSESIWFSDYWRTSAYKYLMIQSDAGTIFRSILEVTLNYDGDGNASSINVKLNSSIGSGAGANSNMIVSFMNTCRLDSDQIVLEHEEIDSILTIKTKVVPG